MRRSGLPALVIVVAFFIGLFSDIEGVGARWMHLTEAYSDGWMMFGVSIFLIVRQWRYRPPLYRPQPLWLLPLLASALLYSTAEWLEVEVVQNFLLIPMLLMALGSIWGWRQLQRFLIPIGIIAMVIPFWDLLNMPLQLITVQANKLLLSPLGINFDVNNVYINLHHVGVIKVANGCSGLRYLIVAISLCLIYGHLTFSRWRTIAKFVATGAAFGIVTNWIRVYVITLVGYESHMKAYLVRHHDFFGWVLFGFILIPLFWLGGLYREKEKQKAGMKENKGNTAIKDDVTQRISNARWTLPLAMILLVAPSFVHFFNGSDDNLDPVAMSLNAPPGWLPAFSMPPAHWKPQLHGATTTTWKSWVKLAPKGDAGEDYLTGYVATYLHQRPGRELVQWGNKIFDEGAWELVGSSMISGRHGRKYNLIHLKSRADGRNLYVSYGYYVSGLWVPSRTEAKLAQLAGLANGRRDNSIIAAGIDCTVTCENPVRDLTSAMNFISEQVVVNLNASANKVRAASH